ncbi:MAG: thiol:disulfide interchange protein, partial [Afipia sp.]|nr:thiol:disulfide interchange protein [Afipia sp.]
MTDAAPQQPQSRKPSRRVPLIVAAVLIGAVLGYAGVYGIGGLTGNPSGDPACRPAVDLARKIAPLARGEMAALTMASAPMRVPDLAFEDGDGKPRKLSEWRGRTVLV